LRWKPALLLSLGLGLIIAVAMADPVPQDPLYHVFADQRTIAGIPISFNVMSNLPFPFVGVLYAAVQFLPILLIPLIIFLYRTRSDLGRYLWQMIGFHVAAKVVGEQRRLIRRYRFIPVES